VTPEKQIDPGHNAVRNALRVAGPVIALIGLGFMIVGLVDFFRALAGDGWPTLFWCAFVGMLLLFVGAGEMTPVGRDTFNYLAEGTREGVQTMAGAIGAGLREGGFAGGEAMVRCHKCNALAPAQARFCGQCGQALGKTKPCPNCREWNDPDARFCDNCGHAFG
jgi:hypothetical protein